LMQAGVARHGWAAWADQANAQDWLGTTPCWLR
jgi:hypothetical protein